MNSWDNTGMKIIIRIIATVAIVLTFGCNDGGSSDAKTTVQPQTTGQAFTDCQDPRPEACTQQYDPVCGLRDTGIRCVTTPCPSSEWKTYGNSCTACSNADVSGYWPGECEPVTDEES